MSKEKTREIKVWLQPQSIEELEQDGFSYATVRNEPRRLYGKIDDVEATLLIKEPEKTVTISESQFEEISKDAPGSSVERDLATDYYREKLFGSET